MSRTWSRFVAGISNGPCKLQSLTAALSQEVFSEPTVSTSCAPSKSELFGGTSRAGMSFYAYACSVVFEGGWAKEWRFRGVERGDTGSQRSAMV